MFGKEPALILGFISAALILAVGFGLRISGEQINNIMLFAGAAIALFGGVVTRQNVVPMAVADRQIEIAKAASVNTPTDQIIREARESL